jgi:hypothetical protein
VEGGTSAMDWPVVGRADELACLTAAVLGQRGAKSMGPPVSVRRLALASMAFFWRDVLYPKQCIARVDFEPRQATVR